MIKDAKTILITVHDSPDSDALGSAFGLKWALEKTAKVDVYLHQPIERLFDFLLPEEYIGKIVKPTLREYDLVIAVDTSTETRAPHDIRSYVKPDGALMIIDHHVGGDDWGDINIREDVAATAIIVTNMIKKMNEALITPKVAQALYTGVSGDTGNFTYSNTDGMAFSVASYLVNRGVDPAAVSLAFSTKTEAHLRLLSDTIQNLKIHEEGFATAYITERMIRKNGATQGDAAGMLWHLRNINGCRGFILFIEDGKDIRIRFRSETENVRELANVFGGGGHEKASGARVVGALRDVLLSVEKEAKEFFKRGA